MQAHSTAGSMTRGSDDPAHTYARLHAHTVQVGSGTDMQVDRIDAQSPLRLITVKHNPAFDDEEYIPDQGSGHRPSVHLKLRKVAV